VDKETFENYVLPIAIFLASIVAWEAIVRFDDIQPYVLPSPSAIAYALYEDWGTLFHSLMVTLSITFEALFTAIVGGVVLALAFHLWRPLERAFFPFAVVMQVTPIIAIAPLLLVYLSSGTAVLVCAFLVAFFPILANTALGLASADHNLVDLFVLYGASPCRPAQGRDWRFESSSRVFVSKFRACSPRYS
jgi:NitT/TauT family transport system permease protein